MVSESNKDDTAAANWEKLKAPFAIDWPEKQSEIFQMQVATKKKVVSVKKSKS